MIFTLKISTTLDYIWLLRHSQFRCSGVHLVCLICLLQSMANIFLEEAAKELKLLLEITTLLLHLGTGGHGDHSTKLFGGHKPCYDRTWPLADRYFIMQVHYIAHFFVCMWYSMELRGLGCRAFEYISVTFL